MFAWSGVRSTRFLTFHADCDPQVETQIDISHNNNNKNARAWVLSLVFFAFREILHKFVPRKTECLAGLERFLVHWLTVCQCGDTNFTRDFPQLHARRRAAQRTTRLPPGVAVARLGRELYFRIRQPVNFYRTGRKGDNSQTFLPPTFPFLWVLFSNTTWLRHPPPPHHLSAIKTLCFYRLVLLIKGKPGDFRLFM